MKIVLTGGGTGGHFFPLIAVAEAIEDICKEKHLIEPQLIYSGPAPFDPMALEEHDIVFKPSPAAKMHRFTSMWNVIGLCSIAWGMVRATLQMYGIYPDVVFSTGGFAAFPTLWGARVLGIPVAIYDADTKPGRVSLWSSKFARWIAVGHPTSVKLYPAKVQKKIAHTGHPIRKEIMHPAPEGGHIFLGTDPSVPTVFVMGGSQGARAINECILDALPELLTRYNVIHQAGTQNLEEVEGIASVVLHSVTHPNRYRSFGLLNVLALRMSAGIADVVIARAGSGTIFEVASWGIPAILIPIPLDVSHDQTENAFTYARSKAAEVIEQQNLTPHVLISEIDRIVGNTELKSSMREAARAFARPDAARTIGQLLIDAVIAHQPV